MASDAPWILVVDDEVGYRNLFEWHLKKLGFNVEVAENGAEAVAMTEKTNFSLVITDITMPELNGIQLLEKLKHSMPQTTVILATGFGTVETAVHAMKMGAYDFLLKPFNIEKFMATVQKALNAPRKS